MYECKGAVVNLIDGFGMCACVHVRARAGRQIVTAEV